MVASGMSERMVDAILELMRAEEADTTNLIRNMTDREARTFDEWVRDNVDAFG